MQNFNILASLSSSAGWIEFYMVASPLDSFFSCIEAHVLLAVILIWSLLIFLFNKWICLNWIVGFYFFALLILY